MALFGSKKNKEEKDAQGAVKPSKAAKKEKPAAAKAPKAPKAEKAHKAPKALKVIGNSSARDLSHVLKRPRITEKASYLSEASVYVFDVSDRASKRDVADAMRFYYKAEPLKVNMIAIPSKNVVVRGKRGVKSGGKKAYVYFEKGTTIEII